MFSVRQKREIADAVQAALRATNHPELPKGEIRFKLRVEGAEEWSWAEIVNNGAVARPGVNPWNEMLDTANAAGEVRRNAVTSTGLLAVSDSQPKGE